MAMKVYSIIPGLFVRGRSDHLPRAEKAAAVADLGLAAVINLWSRPDPDWPELVPWYAHLPIPDGPGWERQRGAVERKAAVLAVVVQEGKSVLVQCHAGRNRSCLVAAMIVRHVAGLSGSAALALVRAQRPNAVANDAFANYLTALA